MSESRVTTSISELVSFINSKIQTNIVESTHRGDFELDDQSLNKLLRLIDLSASEGFSLGMNNVESAIRDYAKELTGKK